VMALRKWSLLRRSLKEKMSKEHLEIIAKLASYGIIVIAALWFMPTVGLEPSGLMVAGGDCCPGRWFCQPEHYRQLDFRAFLDGRTAGKDWGSD